MSCDAHWEYFYAAFFLNMYKVSVEEDPNIASMLPTTSQVPPKQELKKVVEDDVENNTVPTGTGTLLADVAAPPAELDPA